MDYEQKYKQALERAREIFNSEFKPDDAMVLAKHLSMIFPELKESEDERIRRGIIRNLQFLMDRSEGFVKEDLQERIAWLEKQGEQSTDKIEPKFKVGDWLVINNANIYQVVKIGEDNRYELYSQYGETLSVPTNFTYGLRLWTINDAKDGDVLVDSYSKDSIIILYKGIDKERSILAHCGWNGYNLFVTSNDGLGYGGLDNTNYLPATKEQRDLLFWKIHSAGYAWDSEKKELKKIERKKLDADEV